MSALAVCALGHTSRAYECPACSEALTGAKCPIEHWRWYRSRTGSKRIRDAVDRYLSAVAA